MGLPITGNSSDESVSTAEAVYEGTHKTPSDAPMVFLRSDGRLMLHEHGKILPVKIRVDPFGNLHVGCTTVSKEALDKIVEMIRQ